MISGEQIEFSLPERLNLGAYFLDINLEQGRGEATALYHKDKSHSFLDLWRLTNKMGNVLRELGVEPENRVLLILEDSPEWAAAWPLGSWQGRHHSRGRNTCLTRLGESSV